MAEYHDKVAEFEARPSWRAEMQQLVRRMNMDSESTVLDVGCGFGELHSIVPTSRYMGVDPDEKFVLGCLVRRRRAFLGSAECLPLEVKFTDVVFGHSLAHVEDPKTALKEARRVMRVFGRLGIVTPNKWYTKMLAPKNAFTGYSSDSTIRNWYDRTSLRELVSEEFIVLDEWYMGPHAYGLNVMPQSRIALVATPRFV